MTSRAPFNRLILRAVLRNVNPMVIRVISMPDSLDLPDFDEVFRAVLGWDSLGFIFRVHGQEFNSFRRVSRSKTLREFQLRPRETFLYTCGAIDLWEWECRLLDQEPGREGDEAPICLGGRGAAPPEHCGGPTGYRLILKRQKQGEAMYIPVQMEAVIGMLSASDPNEPASTWQTLRQALHDGFQSIDRRLQEYGRLAPERFSLQEANQRLAKRLERMRFPA
jgi:Plasmid pRiA4b ORF-3-like protein